MNKRFSPVVITLLAIMISLSLPAQDVQNQPDKDNLLSLMSPESDTSFFQVTPLTEINAEDTADAYPFLSADGLRLYFVQGADDMPNELYVVSRPDRYSKFSNKTLVSPFFGNGIMACWLTLDELTIYYTSINEDGDNMLRATRNSKTSPFSRPDTVNIEGMNENFFSSVSLTPDQNQMYVYVDDLIASYSKVNDLNFMFSGYLEFPEQYTAGPGQLSKDGLKFYVGLEDSLGNEHIFVLDRKKLTDPFGNLHKGDSLITSGSTNCGQPTVSADGSLFVWVQNGLDVWAENNLFINTLTRENDPEETIKDPNEEDDLTQIEVSIYPNPCKNDATVEFSLNDAAQVVFTVRDISGKVMLSESAEYSDGVHTRKIATKEFPEGVYFIDIDTGQYRNTIKFVKTL